MQMIHSDFAREFAEGICSSRAKNSHISTTKIPSLKIENISKISAERNELYNLFNFLCFCIFMIFVFKKKKTKKF